MSEVYLRKGSPYYWFRTTDPCAGKQVAKSTKRTDEQDAVLVRATWLKQRLDQKQFGYKPECALGDALDAYVQKLEAEGCTWDVANVVKKLKGKMDGRSGFDPSMKLHTLTTGLVEKFKTKRLLEGAAKGTINLELKTLRAARNIMRSEFQVGDAKFETYATSPRKRVISYDEEDALMRELDPNRPIKWRDRFGNEGRTCKVSARVRRQMLDAHDVTVFLFGSACRYGEVASIPWVAVDTAKWEWVNVLRHKIDESERAIGRLAMTDRVREMLQRRWSERRNSPYIFEGYTVEVADDEDEGATHRGKATGAIRRAMGRAGLNSPDKVEFFGRAHVHTIRRTVATRWLEGGMDITRIQVLLGHATVDQTREYLAPDETTTALLGAEILNRRGQPQPTPTPAAVPADGLAGLLNGVSAEQLLRAIALIKSGAA